jgi:pre-60S factor REI1
MEVDSRSMDLTSTTAPGKAFASRSDLASHYKSDWHKYNLKRREAGLPVLLEGDFEARLEAAKAMRQEKQIGKDHLKTGKNHKRHKDNKQEKAVAKASQEAEAWANRKKEQSKPVEGKPVAETEEQQPAAAVEGVEQDMEQEEPTGPSQEQLEKEATIEIEPRQCLFDKHMSKTIEANAERMLRKYGFFLPDSEYLTDMEGLLGYCQEKIKLGHICLYCQRVFKTGKGCQNHMVSKLHTKLRYEERVDLEEFSVFYDFSEADAEFLSSRRAVPKKAKATDEDVEMEEGNEDNAEEWEDVSDDEDEEMEDNQGQDDDQDVYDGFEEQVASMGFDVTVLGELILPDGRIVGHRSLRRYYKQRAPRSDDNTAVLAARSAANERLYRGRVYNIGNGGLSSDLVLAQAGIHPALTAGRAGKGILVPTTAGSFSQLSVYRYRAAIRKQWRGERKGHKIYQMQNQNMNHMDKKHNRLMNNVSVAHAKR